MRGIGDRVAGGDDDVLDRRHRGAVDARPSSPRPAGPTITRGRSTDGELALELGRRAERVERDARRRRAPSAARYETTKYQLLAQSEADPVARAEPERRRGRPGAPRPARGARRRSWACPVLTSATASSGCGSMIAARFTCGAPRHDEPSATAAGLSGHSEAVLRFGSSGPLGRAEENRVRHIARAVTSAALAVIATSAPLTVGHPRPPAPASPAATRRRSCRRSTRCARRRASPPLTPDAGLAGDRRAPGTTR